MNQVIVGLVAAVSFVSVSAYGWSQYASEQPGHEERVGGCGHRGGQFADRGQCVDRRSENREPVDVNLDRRVPGEVKQIQQEDGHVSIENGHATDPRDGGRPIALIAAALGVEDEVFRTAFSDVRPSTVGPPSAWRARENKEKLMNVLKPHGVTNERLDEVSNFYRYRPQDGSLWQHRPAKVEAVIEDGNLISVNVIDGGFGYTTAPTMQVAGHENVRLKAKIKFTQDLGSNGKLVSVDLLE